MCFHNDTNINEYADEILQIAFLWIISQYAII